MNNESGANATTAAPVEEPASTGSALRERLKETISLYESRPRMGLPFEDICRQIFDHLIPAMHFPAMASAMVELDGRRFTQRTIARVIRTSCKRSLQCSIGCAGACVCSIPTIHHSCYRKRRSSSTQSRTPHKDSLGKLTALRDSMGRSGWKHWTHS